MEITIDAVGSAPAGAVWERYMNPRQWSSWATQIVGVEYAEERITAGTFGRVEGPLWIHIDFEVLDVDESEWMWTWKAWWKHRRVGLTLRHGVASRTDGSRTWLSICGSPALIIPYLPVAKLALMRLVRR